MGPFRRLSEGVVCLLIPLAQSHLLLELRFDGPTFNLHDPSHHRQELTVVAPQSDQHTALAPLIFAAALALDL